MSEETGAEVTPEIVRQLLAADIANIIALVNAGQPLTKQQRERIEEFAKKQAKPAQPPAPAPPPPPAPPTFVLIDDAPPLPPADPAKVGYKETQKAYAERYGKGLRTIKLWIAEGREAGKLPPLDDAEAMLAWWHEVKKNRPPPGLLIAAETAAAARRAVEVAAAPPPPVEARTTGDPSPPPPPAATGSQQTTTRATGFAASLERVRVAEAEAHGRYLDALAEPDEEKRNESRIERLRKSWGELSEQLRFLEKAAPDVLSKSGEMLTRAEARRILSGLHGPIVAGVRSLFRRVRAKVGAAASLDDLERAYDSEVERLFAGLCASEFAPA